MKPSVSAKVSSSANLPKISFSLVMIFKATLVFLLVGRRGWCEGERGRWVSAVERGWGARGSLEGTDGLVNRLGHATEAILVEAVFRLRRCAEDLKLDRLFWKLSEAVAEVVEERVVGQHRA